MTHPEPRKFRITTFPVDAVHISLDLETAGISTEAAIVQIGAYNVNTGDTFKCGVSLMDCERQGLVIDKETMEWWDKQDPELRKRVFGSSIELSEALAHFQRWIAAQGDGDYDFSRVVLWGNGVDFDNIILKNAWEKFATWPFSHRNNHHYRTLTALIPQHVLEAAHDEWDTAHGATDDPHDALSDALYQGYLIRGALQYTGLHK